MIPLLNTSGVPTRGLVAAFDPFRQRNIILHSSDLANAAWTRVGLHATEGVVLVVGGGPGGRNAFRLKEDGTAGSGHYLTQPWHTYGLPHIVSFCAKGEGRGWAAIEISAGSITSFNLTTGVVGTVGGVVSLAGMLPLEDGWFLCWMKLETSDSDVAFTLRLASADNTVVYNGDNSSSILFAEPQLERVNTGRITPAAYVPTGDLQVIPQSSRLGRGGWTARRGATLSAEDTDPLLGSTHWFFDVVKGQFMDLGTENFGGALRLFCGPDEQFTVMIVGTAVDGRNQHFVARNSGSLDTGQFCISKLSTNNVFIRLRGAATWDTLPIIGPGNENTHIHTVTWDGVSAKYYLNGSAAYPLNVGTAAEEVGQRVIVGAENNGAGLHLSGSVYAGPYFWKVALTKSEISRMRSQYITPELARVESNITLH